MELSNREAWAALHGMFFGALFLLAFAGGLAGLWSLRPEWVMANGLQERMLRLKVGVTAMAITAWVTVVLAPGSCTPGTGPNRRRGPQA